MIDRMTEPHLNFRNLERILLSRSKRRNLFTGGKLEVIANVQSTREEPVGSTATRGIAQAASSQKYFPKSAKSTIAQLWRISM